MSTADVAVSAVRRRPRRKLNHFARQSRRALYFGGDHCAQAVEHVLSEPHQRKRKVFFDLMHHQARPTNRCTAASFYRGECCAHALTLTFALRTTSALRIESSKPQIERERPLRAPAWRKRIGRVMAHSSTEGAEAVHRSAAVCCCCSSGVAVVSDARRALPASRPKRVLDARVAAVVARPVEVAPARVLTVG